MRGMNEEPNIQEELDTKNEQKAQDDSPTTTKKDAAIAKIRRRLIAAVIFFVCILALVLVVAINHVQNGSASNAALLVVGIVLLITPIGGSFAIDCGAIRDIMDCKSDGIEVPTSMKVIAGLLVLQIPLFVAIFMGSSMIKPVVAEQKVESFISAKYSDYTIVDTCHHFDESIQDYTKIIFEMDGLSKPVTAKYDWQEHTYEDNYEEVKAGTAVQGSEYCS